MPTPVTALLTGLLVLGASVWLGGFVLLILVSRASRQQLEDGARVALFRQVGREFLPVAATAMVVVLVTGGILLGSRPWDGLATTLVVLVVAVIVTTGAGVRQARAMTRLRRRALAADGALATDVATGARRATALRTLIGLLVLALYAVAVVTATHAVQ